MATTTATTTMKEKLSFVAYRDSPDGTSTVKLDKRKPFKLDKTWYKLCTLKDFVMDSCCGEGTAKKDQCKYCTEGYRCYNNLGRFVLEVANVHDKWIVSLYGCVTEGMVEPSVYIQEV